MKARKPFLLRMDPLLFQALEAWAQQDMRSLNGQIEFLLKDALVRRKKALPQDEIRASSADFESTERNEPQE